MQLPESYTTITKRSLDMTLSINPLGCSPRALLRAQSVNSQDIATYPNTCALTALLAKRNGVATGNILLSNGSERLIMELIRANVKRRQLVAVQIGSFPLFSRDAIVTGGRVRLFDPVRESVPDSARLVFLCTPNNPTGEELSPSVVRRIVRQAPPECLIVIDEANGDFSDISFAQLAVDRPNVIVLRTLSKAFGLAGLRIGFAISQERRIAEMIRSGQVFPVSGLSARIAEAAVTDRRFLDRTKRFMARERATVSRAVRALGFTVSESVTNTLFIASPDALSVVERLADAGVSVIPSTSFPGLSTPGFRIALRTPTENRAFVSTLARILHHATAR